MNLSDAFPIQYGPKQLRASWPFLFNCALEYAVWKFQEKQEGLELSGTHQSLFCADYVNTLAEEIIAVGKNTKALLESSSSVSAY
jgi:hypothetical protein